MTTTVTSPPDDFPQDASEDLFTHEILCGCSVLRSRQPAGGVPMQAMLEASILHGREAVLDTDMARMLGAVLVVGVPENLSRLKRSRRVAEGAALIEASLPDTLSREARRWAAWGEQGSSSKALFERLTGIKLGSYPSTAHPLDPADLRRCMLLLEQVPELAARIHEMSEVSAEWGALAEAWDDLTAGIRNENPDWLSGSRRAPRTAELMEAILASGRAPTP